MFVLGERADGLPLTALLLLLYYYYYYYYYCYF